MVRAVWSAVAVLALPDRAAVIVPALKLPLEFRATIAEAVLASVAVVAELATFPPVEIVARLESASAVARVSAPVVLAMVMALEPSCAATAGVRIFWPALTMMSLAPVVLPMASTSDRASEAPTCASTYALMLCWVASAVALSEAILSSSRIFVTVVAPVPFREAKVRRPDTPSAPDRVAAAAVIVPVSVGLADITTFPVPVMALETRPLEASVKTACEAVRLDRIGWAVSVATPVTLNVPVMARLPLMVPPVVRR